MSPSELLEAVRKPQYTGANRCWPCTAANTAILAACSLLVSIVSVPAGVATFLAGVALVWARGYLVPYTPRLTSIVMGHERPDASGPESATDSLVGDTEDVDGEVLLSELAAAGVLTVTADSVAPTEEFRRRWEAEMATLRDADDETLASIVLEASPVATESTVVERPDRRYFVLSDGSGSIAAESWIRRPNAIAQTAAVHTLTEYEVAASMRAPAAFALCMFLTRCPACESELAEDLVGGCCGPPQTSADGTPKSALTCRRCRVHVHVFE